MGVLLLYVVAYDETILLERRPSWNGGAEGGRDVHFPCLLSPGLNKPAVRMTLHAISVSLKIISISQHYNATR